MSDAARDLLRNTAGLVNKRLPPEAQLTDTDILGYINVAYRDVATKLIERQHQALRVEVDLTNIPAGTTAIDSTSTPALPTWLVQPIRIWERQNGTTTWIPMQMAIDHLPINLTSSTAFTFWEFRDGALRFPEATCAMDLRIHALSRLDDFLWPGDTVGMPDLVNAISYAAAALALGGDAFFEKKGNDALQSVANLNAHMKQSQPVRRRRFRRGMRLGR